jgi:exodeoxyribonuclease III
MAERVRIASWNVNGIRSCCKKGFTDWLRRARPDIAGVQEVRAAESDLPEAVTKLRDYEAHFTHAVRRGYSGVGTLSRHPVLGVRRGLGEVRFDDEARVLETEHERFLLFNVYFPKGSGTLRDNSRVPFKLAFYDAFFAHALRRRTRTKKPLVVLGDFNTAHRPIDLKNARSNVTTSGFLPEERAALEKHLDRGFIDTYRHLYPERVQYTWWSQRFGVREKNIGWRIDYVWVSKELLPHLAGASIEDQVRGSDHCPLGVVLEF